MNVQAHLARKRAAAGTGINADQWRDLVAASFNLCCYCGSRLSQPTLDHIESLARGGSHEIDNAAVACRACNCSKSDTRLVVWLARLRQVA
jgi:5-methylcytosine-specific restriction endonuclease McrA